MVTFEKTNDIDFRTYYQVFIGGEYVDYIGVAYDQEYWGTDWVNGSSDIYDIIGECYSFKDIKQAFRDNESKIKVQIMIPAERLKEMA
jgi:hypothetical protein